MAQRLVSIYLKDTENEHRKVQDHLVAELSQGWRITSITGVGAGVGNAGHVPREGHVAGWVVVVLEK
jgi:hypothetical protein